eukprot:321075_1
MAQQMMQDPNAMKKMGDLMKGFGGPQQQQQEEDGNNNDGNKVEWLYSFDVHCNSYFIYFIISNVIVLILTPILLQKSLFSLILGNSIYLTAIIGYFYVTFLGYDALPIIQQSEKLLYPLPIIIILYIISMLCHFSLIQSLLHYHFGYHAN